MWQQFEFFYWARRIAPLSFGVVRYQRELHSGLTCGSGIWSWWLCDSLGWGIAVSAEQVTTSWSVTIFRQAYVRRSYGMAPRCSSKALFPLLRLLITTHHFFFSFQKMGRHQCTVAQAEMTRCALTEWLISENKNSDFSDAGWKKASIVKCGVNEDMQLWVGGFIVETFQQWILHAFFPAQLNCILGFL